MPWADALTSWESFIEPMKHIAAFLLLTAASALRAQVACDIITPGSLQGSYAHTWAEPNPGSWATPDMLDPSTRVIGQLALAYDGSSADSLACGPIVNGSEVSGRIAVLYRGTCDYSEKALFCQNAGALAVVIINNVAGAPAAMGAGSQGTLVNIPVFQIRQDDGAAWRAALEAGDQLTALLGNKDGYYQTDAGLRATDVLMPSSLAQPAALAANPGEFGVEVAATVHNYGMAEVTGIALRARIAQDGSDLYDETSATFNLLPGDSAFISLPDFMQGSWSGHYDLIYTVIVPGSDEHLLDNERVIPFDLGDTYALAPLNPSTGIPVTTIGIQPATSNGEYESCVHFRDVNASRLAVRSMDRYVSIQDPLTLDGEFVFTRVYQWLDNFTGLSDPAFDISALVMVHDQKHILEETGDFAQIGFQLDEPLVLEDNVRYLFCMASINPSVFFGFNEDVHYATTEDVYDQPTCPNSNGGDWFVGFVGGPVASIGVRMIPASSIGIAEQAPDALGASPNPSNGVFLLMLGTASDARISVSDASGRIVRTYRSVGDRFHLDLSGEARGVYIVSVEHDDGRAMGRLVLE